MKVLSFVLFGNTSMTAITLLYDLQYLEIQVNLVVSHKVRINVKAVVKKKLRGAQW